MYRMKKMKALTMLLLSISLSTHAMPMQNTASTDNQNLTPVTSEQKNTADLSNQPLPESSPSRKKPRYESPDRLEDDQDNFDDQDDFDDFDITMEDLEWQKTIDLLKNYFELESNAEVSENDILFSTLSTINHLKGQPDVAPQVPRQEQFGTEYEWEQSVKNLLLEGIWNNIDSSQNEVAGKRDALPGDTDILKAAIHFIESATQVTANASQDEGLSFLAKTFGVEGEDWRDQSHAARQKEKRQRHLSLINWIAKTLGSAEQKEAHVLQDLIEHFDSVGLRHNVKSLRKIMDIRALYDILATQLPGGRKMQRTGGQTGLNAMSRDDALTASIQLLTTGTLSVEQNNVPYEQMRRLRKNAQQVVYKSREKHVFDYLADLLQIPQSERRQQVKILQALIIYLDSLGYTSPIPNVNKQNDFLILYAALGQQMSVPKPVQQKKGTTALHEISRHDLLQYAIEFIKMHWESVNYWSQAILNSQPGTNQEMPPATMSLDTIQGMPPTTTGGAGYDVLDTTFNQVIPPLTGGAEYNVLDTTFNQGIPPFTGENDGFTASEMNGAGYSFPVDTVGYSYETHETILFPYRKNRQRTEKGWKELKLERNRLEGAEQSEQLKQIAALLPGKFRPSNKLEIMEALCHYIDELTGVGPKKLEEFKLEDYKSRDARYYARWKYLFDEVASRLPGNPMMHPGSRRTIEGRITRIEALDRAHNYILFLTNQPAQGNLEADAVGYTEMYPSDALNQQSAPIVADGAQSHVVPYGLTTVGLGHLRNPEHPLSTQSDPANPIQTPSEMTETTVKPLETALKNLANMIPTTTTQLNEQSILEAVIEYLDEINGKQVATLSPDSSLDAVSSLYREMAQRLPGSWDISNEKSRTILLKAVIQHIQHLQMMKAFLESTPKS